MSLNHVLSAMKTLILDCREIPGSQEERLVKYSELFPHLKSEELEDLAKISGSAWDTYTASIFSGEANVLEKHFRMTVSLMREASAADDTPFSFYDFVRDMHDRFPWNDASSATLGVNFVEYLRAISAENHRFSDMLLEAAEFEKLILLLKKSAAEKLETLTLEQISTLTVDELLSCQVTFSGVYQQGVFTHDMPALRKYYYQHGNTLPENITAAESNVVISRGKDHLPQINCFDKSTFQYLKNSRGCRCQLDDFAEYCISSEGFSALSEEEAFNAFVSLTASFVKSGVAGIFR